MYLKGRGVFLNRMQKASIFTKIEGKARLRRADIEGLTDFLKRFQIGARSAPSFDI